MPARDPGPQINVKSGQEGLEGTRRPPTRRRTIGNASLQESGGVIAPPLYPARIVVHSNWFCVSLPLLPLLPLPERIIHNRDVACGGDEQPLKWPFVVPIVVIDCHAHEQRGLNQLYP